MKVLPGLVSPVAWDCGWPPPPWEHVVFPLCARSPGGLFTCPDFLFFQQHQ